MFRFRSAGGRVVPYYEVIYDAIPVTELILGAAIPMYQLDLGLQLLLRSAGLESMIPQQSTVSVRP